MSGIMDVGHNLSLITGFLTKGHGLEPYWSMIETKEVYFKNRYSETHVSFSTSNVQIFDEKSWI